MGVSVLNYTENWRMKHHVINLFTEGVLVNDFFSIKIFIIVKARTSVYKAYFSNFCTGLYIGQYCDLSIR